MGPGDPLARFRVAFAALAALSLRERAGAGANAAVAAGCADARRGRRWAGADDQLGDGKMVIFSTGGLKHEFLKKTFYIWDVIRNLLTNSMIFQDGFLTTNQSTSLCFFCFVLDGIQPEIGKV